MSAPASSVADEAALTEGPSSSRMRLASLRRMATGRNGLMLADTGINALAGLCLVAGAARQLGPRDLAAFSLAQLVVTLMVSTLRSAVYGPAMAAQRATGRAVVPTDWAFSVSIPVGVVLGGIVVLLVPGLGEDKVHALVPMAAITVVILLQDGLRSAIISRERPQWALVADTLTFALLLIPILRHSMPQSAIGYLGSWALTVLVGTAVTLFGLFRTRHGGYTRQSMASAWRLGRWAALDSGFAVTAYLLPMFVATIYVGNTAAGTYRVLQTALGPLNIIQSTVVTVFGLDAWQTATLDGLRAIKKKVQLLFGALLGLSACSAAAGLPLMAVITHLKDPSLLRIALIVAAHGIMTAVTTPFMAASLALGYQKFGAFIRFAVLVACAVVSLPVAGSRWLPWHDPIGTAMLISSGFTLVGWACSYVVATNHEEQLLSTGRHGVDEGAGIATTRSRSLRHRGRHRR